ncbi:oxidoreductase-like domain-containing protein [Paraburkholderia sp.]|uniref:oxidoreductase-like domain-containing protein n=1 Tax=Paraburkholderia sp. TaxID=1926495 RepID=UPI002382CF04|nr:oxidoreductase-like domain-containing protein [Paraburkholderia sp.]MDE1179726.1 oxidoreductase-like domain-containing protein [Paraburkholderia sp.]
MESRNTPQKPAVAADDPPPVPPDQPDLNDCCRSGCEPCIFDLYDADLARYREKLAEWQARHADSHSKST